MRVLGLCLVAATVCFVVVLAVLGSSGEGQAPRPAVAPAPARAPGSSTDARLAGLQRVVRSAPGSADGYTALAGAYLQKVRETGDAGYYRRAERAIARALDIAPDSASALTERGALRLARHDFRRALDDGRRAHRLAPEVVKPYGVIVDANLELGRYQAAGEALQRMIDLKPDLASYTRVSYFRELHGDLPGAVEAMELAVSAGGAVPENAAYTLALLGDLQLARGRSAAAARAYRSAMLRFKGHLPARAGLARVRATRGDLDGAIAELREVVERLPLAQYVIALGEAELVAGNRDAARRTFDLMRAQQRLLDRSGVNSDAELALFEADHGDAARAVALARAAWRNAPSVRSADALGWALTRSGSPDAGYAWGRRALKLGSRDASFLYHAGVSARAAGRRASASRLLLRAVRANHSFSSLYAQRELRDLESP